MPKGYFISAHRSTADPEKRAAYLKLAGPAIEKYNGKILASTNKIKVFEETLQTPKHLLYDFFLHDFPQCYLSSLQYPLL